MSAFWRHRTQTPDEAVSCGHHHTLAEAMGAAAIHAAHTWPGLTLEWIGSEHDGFTACLVDCNRSVALLTVERVGTPAHTVPDVAIYRHADCRDCRRHDRACGSLHLPTLAGEWITTG